MQNKKEKGNSKMSRTNGPNFGTTLLRGRSAKSFWTLAITQMYKNVSVRINLILARSKRRDDNKHPSVPAATEDSDWCWDRIYQCLVKSGIFRR